METFVGRHCFDICFSGGIQVDENGLGLIIISVFECYFYSYKILLHNMTSYCVKLVISFITLAFILFVALIVSSVLGPLRFFRMEYQNPLLHRLPIISGTYRV
jgi:hypothetical protein